MVRPMRSIATLLLAALALTLPQPTAASAAPGVVGTTATQRATAAGAAATKVGAPYHAGAAGPGRFDCSGLVAWAFGQAGTTLGGRSSFDLWNHGVRIGRMALRRGDLVWTWDRSRGHVGIYLGSGRYVHAPGRGRRVEVAPLPAGPAFVGAVRP